MLSCFRFPLKGRGSALSHQPHHHSLWDTTALIGRGSSLQDFCPKNGSFPFLTIGICWGWPRKAYESSVCEGQRCGWFSSVWKWEQVLEGWDGAELSTWNAELQFHRHVWAIAACCSHSLFSCLCHLCGCGMPQCSSAPGSGTHWKKDSGKHNCIFLWYFGKLGWMQPQIICMGVSACVSTLCDCKIISAVLKGATFILLTNPFLLRALQPSCMQVLAACPCSSGCCGRAGRETCSRTSLHPPVLQRGARFSSPGQVLEHPSCLRGPHSILTAHGAPGQPS